MKNIAILISLLLLFSCNTQEKNNITQSVNSTKVVLKSTQDYLSYFTSFKTPLGKMLKYEMLNDSSYLIQWGDSLNLQTLPDTFQLDGHESWIPKYISEDKNYIVLRKGCGNPCWAGIFLPLEKSIKPHIIHEYLDFDLENDLVAYINENNIIIINLKTNRKEIHKTVNCQSAFIGYCIDTISIKNKNLKYKWISNTKFNSKDGFDKEEKINL